MVTDKMWELTFWMQLGKENVGDLNLDGWMRLRMLEITATGIW